MKRKGGYRHKTRKLWRKNWRDKGKISLSHYFAELATGEHVALLAEPAVQKGLYHARYHGLTGVVLKSRGDCYEVQIHDGDKYKMLVIHPVHLRKV